MNIKSWSFKSITKPISIFLFTLSLLSHGANPSYAEDLYLKEMKIDSSTKAEENESILPTNPFEIVDMIRRANSLNDATKPSDAIDDALKSLTTIETEPLNK